MLPSTLCHQNRLGHRFCFPGNSTSGLDIISDGPLRIFILKSGPRVLNSLGTTGPVRLFGAIGDTASLANT